MWTSFRKNKKQLKQSLFEQKDMQIIIECDLRVVNRLDVTFNLNNDSYRSYRKPNDETQYIHIHSGPLKSVYHSYHRQKIYFMKRHHMMSSVSPTADITKN